MTELGTVRSVVNRDGQDFLVFDTIDNSGSVQTSEIDAGSITNVLPLKDVEGKQVQAVTNDGEVLSGTAIAATANGTRPRILVQGISIGLDRVVGVELN